MTKEKLKKLADIIPLAILVILELKLIWYVTIHNYGYSWKHYVGFNILPINLLLFFRWHKVAVLVLGITLLMGVLSIWSYNHSIVTATTHMGKSGVKLLVFYGQPVFVIWLLAHFIISIRHYIGIGTKKYWEDLFQSIRVASKDNV